MRYSTYLSIVIILLMFITCKKESKPFDNNFIPVNECRSFTIGEKTLNLCLDSVIQDSRCPIDALCIWAGVGVARFTASVQGQDHVITLATAKMLGYNTATVVEGITIEFVHLNPFTEEGKIHHYDEYVAEVKITRP